MRLLRVDYAKSPNSLDLHPLVTVVDGLSESERTELIEHVRQLAAGSAGELRGLAHHSQELVDLHGGDHGLSLGSTDVDPVVTDRRQTAIPSERVDDRLALARIEEVRSRLAPSSYSRVLELRHRLAALDEIEGAAEHVAGRESLPALRPVAGQSPVAESVDPETYAQVGEAFLAVQQIPRTIRVQLESVVELQQRWSRFEVRATQSEQHTNELGSALESKTELLAVAEGALRAAEESARPVLLTPKQEERLEQLAEKSEGEKRRWRRSGQLSASEQEEFNGLLRQVGAQSWTEYSVFRLAPTVAEEKQREVDEAAAAYAQAEADVHAAREAIDQDPLTVELEAEKGQLREAASQYLGALMPADLGPALLSLGQDELNPQWAGLVTELCRVLDQAHLEPDLVTDQSDDPRSDLERTADQVLNWTRGWLAGQEQAMLERDQSEHVLVDRHEVHEALDGATEGQDLEMLRESLSAAEEQLVGHQRALSRLISAGAEPQLEVAEAEPSAGSSLGEESRASTMGERLGRVVDSAVGDVAGSLPVVLEVDFELFDREEARQLLDQCSELADRAQIIVLSASEIARTWAVEAGKQAALYSARTSVSV